MQLEFVSVEEFYFALTLDTRLLHAWSDAALATAARERLAARFGQSSTVAAAEQNTFNYVFRVRGDVPEGTLVEVFDWGSELRLASNYGLVRTAAGKVNRLESFAERPAFAARVAASLATLLDLELAVGN